MTISVTHIFVSLKGDGADTTVVKPSNWNDKHVLATDQTVPIVLGRQSAGAGPLEELPLSAIFPTGVVVPFAGGTAPVGWLLCNGQTLLKTDYPTLSAAIGNTFGGSGTHFKLPDLRGAVVAGKSNMGGSDAGNLPGGGALGALLGSADQSSGVSVSVSGGVSVSVSVSGTLTGVATANATAGAGSGAGPMCGDQASVSVAGSMGGGGGGTFSGGGGGGTDDFSVVQPTIVLNYIIRT